jgi:hypothetical protein
VGAMKKILIISGKQKSGKTTTTKEIIQMVESIGYVTRVFKLADPIYEIQQACEAKLKGLDLWPRGLDGQWLEKDGDFLQVIGTEYGRRRRGDDVWIKKCRDRVDDYLKHFEPGRGWASGDPIGPRERIAIIDDCRFENEFDAFPDAFRARLECPEEIRKARPGMWRENTQHESEVGLDKYAEEGRFDMRLWTNDISPQGIAHSIRLEWFTPILNHGARAVPLKGLL